MWASLVAQMVKHLPANAGDSGSIPWRKEWAEGCVYLALVMELVYNSFSHPRVMLVCGALNFYVSLKGCGFRTSLVVQWIRIRLPVQRTQV